MIICIIKLFSYIILYENVIGPISIGHQLALFRQATDLLLKVVTSREDKDQSLSEREGNWDGGGMGIGYCAEPSVRLL